MTNMTGTVTKIIDQKTAKVEVARMWQHPLYKKYVKRTKSYVVDTSDKAVEIGQEVGLMQTRPLSATKRFKVVA